MTELPSRQPVVSVKPQSNIYTLLIIVAIVALATAIGLALYDLMSQEGYGVAFWDIFVPLKDMKSLPREVLDAGP